MADSPKVSAKAETTSKQEAPASKPAQPATAGRKKTTCPVSREQFQEKAKPLSLDVDGTKIILNTKEFKGKKGEVDGTGSLGWFNNDKITVMVDGVACKAQANISIVLVGSKVE